MDEFRSQVARQLAHAAGVDTETIAKLIEDPKDEAHGDFAIPCFHLAKTLKKAPAVLAAELVGKLKPHGAVKEYEALGAYINVRLREEDLARHVLALAAEPNWGLSVKREKVMIEFCQANTHKPFHIGHFRNICLGDALVRIYRYLGHEVIAANYQGDIGAHVAKCLWALRKFHKDDTPPERHRGEWLGGIYAEGNAKAEEDPAARREIAETLVKLEGGDPELTALWNKTRQWCLDEFDHYYELMGVSFDQLFFESEFEKPGKILVQQLLERGIAQKSEGAIIVDLKEFGLDIFLILKSDGAALYGTKDIALAKHKFEHFGIERSVNVVGSEQKLYFKQLFKTLELMGFANAKNCFHLAHELVSLPEGKMSSRLGNVVTFREVYEEADGKAQDEVRKRHMDWDDEKVRSTSRAITLSAMRYAMIAQDTNKVIVFSIERALDFEGETGPYLQYALARINSILRKHAGAIPHGINVDRFAHPAEIRLIKMLARFPEVIEKSATEYRPMRLAKAAMALAQAFSDFYQNCPVLKEDDQQLKMARLRLLDLVRSALQDALKLLGMPIIEEM